MKKQTVSRAGHDELTPDVLLDYNIFTSPDKMADYDNIACSIEHHKKRERFCYVQTPGFFEHFNTVFGIEDLIFAYDLIYKPARE